MCGPPGRAAEFKLVRQAHLDSSLSYAKVCGAYALFIVVYFLLAFLEGAVRGAWQLTSADFNYQLSAYIAFYGVGMVLAGIASIPLSITMLDRLSQQRRRNVAAPVAAVLGIGPVLGSCALLSLLLSGDLRAVWSLVEFPASFVVSAGLFGILSERAIRRSRHAHA